MGRKKWSKKIMSGVLIISLMMGVFGCREVKAAAVVASGNMETISWNINTDGILSFDGSGSFPAFERESVPWYLYRSQIKKVIFNMDSVTSGDVQSYFYNCTNLLAVNNIPAGVQNMDEMFMNCSGLVSVGTIPQSVVSMNETFKGCKALNQSLTIPAKVTQAKGVFNGCSSLTITPTITADGITDLSYAFQNTAITSAPVIPLKTVNMYRTFYGCKKIKRAPTIPGCVSNMGYTFYDCVMMTTAADIPSSVSVMPYAFYNCSYLTASPIIQSTKVSDMSYCFYNCTSMTTAPTLPTDVRNINYAFWNCSSMTNAPDIPLNVECMTNCFAGCTRVSGEMNIYACLSDSSHYNQFAGESSIYNETSSGTFLGAAGSGLKINYINNNKDYIMLYLSEGWNSGSLSYRGYCGNLSTGKMIAQSVNDCSVSKITSYAYSGQSITPQPNVYYGSKKLTLNTDYSLSYENNVNAGMAAVIIKGKGNYSGTKSVNFTINKIQFEAVKAYSYDGIYDGKGHSITVVCDTGATVEYGTVKGQYTTSASPTFVLPGTYTVFYQVTKNNYVTYTGQSTVSIGLASLNIKTTDYEGTYDGNPHSANVIAEEGALVKYGTSEGSYSTLISPTFINAGTYKVYYQISKTGYITKTGCLNVIIAKKKVQSIQFPNCSSIVYGERLGQSLLSYNSNDYGTFYWNKSSAIPGVVNDGYEIIFKPKDKENYDFSSVTGYAGSDGTVHKMVAVTVVPKAGVLPAYTVDILAEGDLLGLSQIHTDGDACGEMMWENPTQTVGLYSAEYNMKFVPNDVVNYDWSILSGWHQRDPYAIIKVKVTVLPYPKASDIVYGQKLRASLLQNSYASGVSYYYCNPEDKPESNGLQDVVFILGESQLIRKVFVRVNKADPVYEKPLLSAIVYNPKQSLRDITLPAGWRWTDEDIIPSVESQSYEAVYSPEDLEHYNCVTETLDLCVEKALPNVSVPYICGGIYENGIKLSAFALPQGWRWENPSEIIQTDKSCYRAVYTPEDTKNYSVLQKDIQMLFSGPIASQPPTSSMVPTGSPAPIPTSLPTASQPPTESQPPIESPQSSFKPHSTFDPQTSMKPEQGAQNADTETADIDLIQDEPEPPYTIGDSYEEDEAYSDGGGYSFLDDSLFENKLYTQKISTIIDRVDNNKKTTLMSANSMTLPAQVKLKKIQYKKGKLIIRWHKLKGIAGYQVKIIDGKKKLKKKLIIKPQKKKIKVKWKKKRNCKIWIRSFYIRKKKRVFGMWSKSKAYRKK